MASSFFNSCCFPSKHVKNADDSTPVRQSNKWVRNTKILAVALIVIGALVLILLAAHVFTPALLAAISLSQTSVALIGFSALAAGGLSLFGVFACKCVRESLQIGVEGDEPKNHVARRDLPIIPRANPGTTSSPSSPPAPSPSPSGLSSSSTPSPRPTPSPLPPSAKEKEEKTASASAYTDPLANPAISIAVLSEMFGAGSIHDYVSDTARLAKPERYSAVSFFLEALPREEIRDGGKFSKLAGELEQVQEILIKVGELGTKFSEESEKSEKASAQPEPKSQQAHFSEWMVAKIAAMTPGTSLLIPAGWKPHDKSTILLKIETLSDGSFELTIYNTGPGLEYHTPETGMIGGKRLLTKKLRCSRAALLQPTVWAAHHIMTFCRPNEPSFFYEKFLKIIVPKEDSEKFGESDRKVEVGSPIEVTGKGAKRKSEGETALWMSPQTINSPVHALSAFIQQNYGIHKFVFWKKALEKHLITLKRNKAFELSACSSSKEIREKLAVINLLSSWVQKFALAADGAIRKEEIIPEFGQEIETFLGEIEKQCNESRELFLKHLTTGCESISQFSRSPTAIEAHSIPSKLLHEPRIEFNRIYQMDEVIPWKKLLAIPPVWPRPEELQVKLKEWYEYIKTNDEPRSDSILFRYLQNFYANMPSANSPYWEKIPKDDCEKCLQLIASFAPLFFQAQKSCANGTKFLSINLLYMKKALMVVHKLVRKIPTKLPGAERYVIDTSKFLNQDKSSFGLFPDPIIEETIRDTSEFGSTAREISFSKSFRIEKDTISPIVDLSEEDFAAIAKLAASTGEILSLREEVLVWNYLSMNPKIKEAIRKERGAALNDRDVLGFALADVEGRFIPPAFYALKLQAYAAQACASIASETSDKRFLKSLPVIKDPGVSALIVKIKTGRKLKRHNEVMIDAEKPPEGSKLTVYEWRALQHLCCEEDEDQQVVKTIGYFKTNIRKLLNPDFQALFMTLVFEPGVLPQQLREHPEFLKTLQEFVVDGIGVAKKEKNLKVALFFVRMGDYFDRYSQKKENECKERDEKSEKDVAEATPLAFERLLKLAGEPSIAESSSDKTLVYIEMAALWGRREEIQEKHLGASLKVMFFLSKHFDDSLIDQNPVLIEEYTKFRDRILRQINKLLIDPRKGTTTVSKIFTEATDPKITSWWFNKYPLICGKRIDTESGIDTVINMREGANRPDGYSQIRSLPLEVTGNPDFISLGFSEGSISNVLYDSMSKVYVFTVKERGQNQDYRVCLREGFSVSRKFGIKEFAHIIPADIRMRPETYVWFERFVLPQEVFSKKNLREELAKKKDLNGIYSNCEGWQCPETNIITFIDKRSGAIYTSDSRTFSCIDREFGNLYLVQSPMSPAEEWLQETQGLFGEIDNTAQFWREYWTGAGDSRIVRVNLPRYNLEFRLKGAPPNASLVSESFPGWQLSKELIPSLYRVPGYLVLRNAQNERRILIPKCGINTEHTSIDSHSSLLSFNVTPPYEMYEYQLDKDGEVVSSTVEGKLYLAHLHICQRTPSSYDKALNILTDLTPKIRGYSEVELTIFSTVILSTRKADVDPRACALRLKALALLEDNLNKYGREKWKKTENFDPYLKNNFQRDIEICLSSQFSSGTYALSKEEWIVIRSLYSSINTPKEVVASISPAPSKSDKASGPKPLRCILPWGIPPIHWKWSVDLEIIQKKPYLLGEETNLGFHFLSYYAIARGDDAVKKKELSNLLFLVPPSDSHWYYFFAAVLKDVLKRPEAYPSVGKIEQILTPSKEYQEIDILIKEYDVLLETDAGITFLPADHPRNKHQLSNGKYMSAHAQRDVYEEPWAENVIELFKELRDLVPAETLPVVETVKPHFPIKAPSSTPKPIFTIPTIGLLPSPSLFPDSTPVSERSTSTTISASAPITDSKEEKSKEIKLESDSPKIESHKKVRIELARKDQEHQEALKAIQSKLFNAGAAESAGKGEAETKTDLVKEKILKRLRSFETSSVVERRGLDKLITDVESYTSQKTSRAHTINSSELPKLKKELVAIETDVKNSADSLENEILELANEPDMSLNVRLALAKRGKKRRPLTIDQLMIMVLNNDVKAFRKHNRALKDADITLLKAKIELFLVRKTHHQHIVRMLECINKLAPTSPSAHIPPALLHEYNKSLLYQLNAQRHYSISPAESDKHYFKFLVIEYQRNILLREEQIKELSTLLESNNNVQQIPMGSGKTDVLLVLQLLNKANGTNLAIGMITSESKKVVVPQLQASAAKIYKQQAHRVAWKRATTLEGLKAIHGHLEQIIRTRGFLIVSNNEMHRFALAARENRLQCSKGNVEARIKEYWFREIKKVLKTKGDVIIDEIDSELAARQEEHMALDDEVQVGKPYVEMTTALYHSLLEDDEIQSLFYFEGLSRKRVPGAVPFSSDSKGTKRYESMQKRLIAAGLEHLKKDPKFAELIGKYDPLALTKYLELEKCLSSKEFSENAPLFEEFATIRALVHTFIPLGLEKIRKHHFGLLPEKNGKFSLIAGPYELDNPKVGSQFAHFLEQFVYTLNNYHETGIFTEVIRKDGTENSSGTDLIRKELERINILANKEKDACPRFLPLEDTKAFREFREMCGDWKELNVKHLTDYQNEDNLKMLAEHISNDPKLVTHFVGKYILPTVRSTRKRISSNAWTLPEMFFRVQGFSGTLANQDTFSDVFNPIPRKGIDAKIIHTLCEHSKIDIISDKEEKESKEIVDATGGSRKRKLENKALHILRESFKSNNLEYRAIIDLGGTFKDVRSEKLAREILDLRGDLKAVFYFDKDRPKTLLREGVSARIVEGHSPDILPEQRFTIYGQLQCTGTHIDQALTAKAFVTVCKDSSLRDLLQAVSRMRGLGRGQEVSFVLSTDLAELIRTTLDKHEREPIEMMDIILFTLKKQCRQQGKDNLTTVYHKLENIVFREIDRILDVIPVDALSSEFYKQLNDRTLTIVEETLSKDYGEADESDTAEKCLEAYMNALLNPINDLLGRQIAMHEVPNVVEMTTEMLKLIQKTIKDALIEKTLSKKIDTKKGQQVSIDVHNRQQVNQNVAHAVSINQHLEDARNKLRSEAGLASEHISLWRTIDPPTSSFAEAQKAREEYASAVVPIAELLKRHLVQSARSSEFMEELISQLFNDNLLMTLDLALTEERGTLFGMFQKPIDRALIIRQKDGTHRFALIDGYDAKQIKDLIRSGNGLSDTTDSVCLYHIQECIFHQKSGKFPIKTEELRKGDLAKFIVQMKFLAGEIWNYSVEERALLVEWLGKVNAAQAEEFFYTVMIKQDDTREEFAGSVLGNIFEQLKKLQKTPASSTTSYSSGASGVSSSSSFRSFSSTPSPTPIVVPTTG